ncbi:MAG: M13 family metallopeptidase [Deltaproteobacteria bacterium]|nr:M13 family metallopeptidase [Deltaproteobacteria bacterium]
MDRRLLMALTLAAGCTSAPTVITPPPPPAGIDATILDRSADPCADFYQFACGGWLARTEIPPDRPTWSRGFSEIQERNLAIEKQILEDYAAGQKLDDVPEAKKLGDYFAACMDEQAVEKANLAPLETELARLRVRDAASLEQAVARLQNDGIRALFTLGEDQDARDATQVVATLGQGGMGLPDRDYYLRDDPKTQRTRDAYLAHVQKMLELSGVAPADAQTQARSIFHLEKELATAALSRVDRRDPQKTYHRLELAGLTQLAPHFDWAALFVDLGHPGLKAINVSEPEFFKELDALVQATPPADWNAYLRWHLLNAAAPALPARFVDEDFAFTRELTGAPQNLPRWKRCVASTDKNLGFALAHAYVKRVFPPESRQVATDLVKEIESGFGSNLDGLAWMDAATKQKAQAKLSAVANQVGYPETWRSYDALEIQRDAYLRDVFAGRAFDLQYELDKVGRPVDKAEWHMTPPTVNAYYSDSLNQMVFLAGILQPPFFGRESAAPVNYGGIGMVVGHELTHGFDDKGRQFDASGNLADWWSPEAGKAFTERASCVQKQFDGYVAVDDVHVNGALTLGENIADLGGMKLSFAAMQAREAKTPSAAAEFTPEQAFFLGQAQAWCRKDREPYARLLATIDPHSPAKWRVVGPMSNLPQFAAAWHCPATAQMVRPAETRCEVW